MTFIPATTKLLTRLATGNRIYQRACKGMVMLTNDMIMLTLLAIISWQLVCVHHITANVNTNFRPNFRM
jgi:hypothetical protein